MRGIGVPVGTLARQRRRRDHGRRVIGIVVTLLGAFWPARRAGRVSPIRAVLGSGERAPPGARSGGSLIGLALFLPGALVRRLVLVRRRERTGGLAAYGGIVLTMAMFAGMAIAAPFLIMPVVRVLAVPFRRVAARPAGDSPPTRSCRTRSAPPPPPWR